MTEQFIAKEIHSQIAQTCRGFFTIYGCRKFVALDRNKDREGGLQFDVRGHFKGRVVIELNQMDEYKVTFGRVVKRGYVYTWKVDKVVERVQWEDFPKVLSYVENKGKSNSKLLKF